MPCLPAASDHTLESSGTRTDTELIPVDWGMIGVSVFAQALLLPYGGPWRLTNVTADKIVR